MKRINPRTLKGKQRVFRGGYVVAQAVACRSAYRYRLAPSYASDALGLRLVLKKK